MPCTKSGKALNIKIGTANIAKMTIPIMMLTKQPSRSEDEGEPPLPPRVDVNA